MEDFPLNKDKTTLTKDEIDFLYKFDGTGIIEDCDEDTANKMEMLGFINRKKGIITYWGRDYLWRVSYPQSFLGKVIFYFDMYLLGWVLIGLILIALWIAGSSFFQFYCGG